MTASASGSASPGGIGALRRSSEFRAVMREGRRVGAGLVVLYVRPRQQGVRAGFVCARRVGNAVARNRARRQIREAWRALAAGARPGFDVVFAARPEIRGTKTQDLIEDMRRALIEVGVIAP